MAIVVPPVVKPEVGETEVNFEASGAEMVRGDVIDDADDALTKAVD
jgi:hypothetical protein